MIKRNKINLILAMLICVLCSACLQANAQQTIINVPSSEVLPSGDIILKESNFFSPFRDSGTAALTPSVIMGVGHGAEVSVGAGTAFNQTTVVKGHVSAKKVWFLGSATRLTVGGTISPYFSQHYQPDTFLYAHFSQRIKKTKTSLTAGGYINGSRSFPNAGGVLLGVEQVLIPNKLRLAADWLSTDNSAGRFAAGLKYRPHPTLSITSAVIVPNEDDENIGFNISVSKFISLKDFNTQKRRL